MAQSHWLQWSSPLFSVGSPLGLETKGTPHQDILLVESNNNLDPRSSHYNPTQYGINMATIYSNFHDFFVIGIESSNFKRL